MYIMNILTVEELNSNLKREAGIIKHLVSKLPEGALTYKPTEKQRTTLELLHYMSHVVASFAETIKVGKPDAFRTNEEQAKAITLETFGAALDASVEKAAEVFNSLTEAEVNEAIDPFGAGAGARRGWMVSLLGTLVAYKMQLFLYAKAAGNDTIGTSNLWMGIDWPQQ
jgi:hypothetical protein